MAGGRLSEAFAVVEVCLPDVSDLILASRVWSSLVSGIRWSPALPLRNLPCREAVCGAGVDIWGIESTDAMINKTRL